jgi:hypothetical protein
MKRCLSLLLLYFALILAAAGCENEQPTATQASAGEPAKTVEAKKVPLGKNVWLEVQGDRRRVLIDAYVCLREGQLEQLMCRRHTKEHEAILAADMDARDIHKGLLLAGVVPGTPVQYQPKYLPPTGPAIKVTLRYEEKGKLHTVHAQQWVRDAQTQKALNYNWVFVGSQFIPNEDKNKPAYYAANAGDVICVSNFDDALLDLPIKSSKDNAELAYEAWTDRIPPLETSVTIILEPMVKPKEAK